MPDPQIFKATYSGVPVYEMIVKSIALMRRRSDGWLNATQILKVAGFDKPQRTRVLEREVQKGEHEKVQGGYGKYQGTWVPPEIGLGLAKQYNCEAIIRPILDFVPENQSPPPAPKHANTPGKSSRRDPTGTSMMATRSSARRVFGKEGSKSPSRGSEDASMTSSPSEGSSSSRTPSPLNSAPQSYDYDGMEVDSQSSARKQIPRKRKQPLNDPLEPPDSPRDSRSYSDQILEYFISETDQIPKLLLNPPRDFDPNIPIDDDEHTALHWACAMARVKVVKLLLSAGADIFRVNKSGQTALMRSVMFANNYDIRKFGELYEILHRSTLNIDNMNRTVFHHAVDLAMTKGKTHAARYYLEALLNRLADYPKELADIINFQDEDGETALTLAARCRSKRLVKLLIDHGADPKIANNDGKSTEDYILDDERFRSSPTLPTRTAGMSYRNAQAAQPSSMSTSWLFSDQAPLHHSMIAQRASTKVVRDMASLLETLASSFDAEILDKERDSNQAHALLSNIEAEIVESKRTVHVLQTQAGELTEATQRLDKLKESFAAKMGKRYRLGWEKWSKDEEEREAVALREGSGNPERTGHDLSDLIALQSDIPQDPVGMANACDAVRSEINRFRKRRKEGFEAFITFQAEAGTGGKMSEYKKLIAAGCGNIPFAEIDGMLPMLLETLEGEDMSSWGLPTPGLRPTPAPTASG
ncbi:apses-domain-containing protein [Sistotremastrum niveocremeum HHB9708]|uniref:Apses-domain-containing protein n=2 Tax=Sistotremastraceae TaxID=3402574 RepID=A0A164VGU2_9AGAM|nr:apses-domain-containing protein [Sistotremastrum niveocremeum HHB9708]KZT38926.1 apses-domain-containing protein [Sistotremastrum suecicum HHB10207 ss-3]